jgi:acetate kinase
LKLDERKNAQSRVDNDDKDIAASGANVRVLVIHAQEDWMIARECWNLVGKQSTATS